MQTYCPVTDDARKVIQDAFDKLGLSARSYDRILKVARTIADTAGAEVIGKSHAAAAIQYGSLNWKYKV